MKNCDVKTVAKKKGVYLWQVAEALGMADTTLCRKLRKELTAGEKERIFSIIDQLSRGVN